jgi:hypothetical protein
VSVAVVVSVTTDVCNTVESVGTSPVTVPVTVVGAGTIELVTVTTLVAVLRVVFVTRFGSY